MAQQLGNVAVGTVLKLNESGSPQNYIVVHQGKPSSMYDASCNGTWLLRQDIYYEGLWNADGYNSFTGNNGINYIVNYELIQLFSSEIQSVIKTVKIPYCVGGGSSQVNSGANGYSTKLFLLSAYEVGWTTSSGSYFPIDGAKLSYFQSGTTTSADKKRIANYNGSPASWWTRSPYTDNGFRAWYVRSDGAYNNDGADRSHGVRPAMVMPSDLIVDDNGNITANTVPNAPASITVPTSSVPAGSTIAVSWSAVSGASSYTLQRSVNGESWQTIQNNASTSYNDVAGAWTQVQYRVAAVSSGFTSAYVSSTVVTVLPYTIDTLTVPRQIMQGQSVPISWSAVSQATNYILERNADSGGWTQIYSGSGTSYTDTPGSWSTVQYRVKAGANDVYGAYNTSAAIPVISASALVISGSDTDLGTITSDVPYTVSSDTGNQISIVRTVNDVQYAAVTVDSGFAYNIPVMELPTGEGTIKITATVENDGSPVTATRTWTYTKTAITFPNIGGVAGLTLNDQNVLPVTIAEAVRTPIGWGGSLDKTLELLSQMVSSGAQIETGTYQGTGTYGSGNQKSLTFNFPPKLLYVSPVDQNKNLTGIHMLVCNGVTNVQTEFSGQNQTSNTFCTVSFSENTVAWYSSYAADSQLNAASTTYFYVAIG